jgi:hypothetical protein
MIGRIPASAAASIKGLTGKQKRWFVPSCFNISATMFVLFKASLLKGSFSAVGQKIFFWENGQDSIIG